LAKTTTEERQREERGIMSDLPDTTQAGELGTWFAPFRLIDAAVASKAASTRVTYGEAFKDFGQYLECDPETALQRLVRFEPGPANALLLSYQEYLCQRSLSPATCNLRLAALRSVVRTARRLGISTLYVDVPGLRSEAYRDLSGPPPELALGVVRTLSRGSTVKARRDYCMIRLAIALGLRRNEILSLDVEHVDLIGSKLWVLGKGKRERKAVTMPGPTLEAIKAWISVRGDEPGPLFVSLSRNGRRTRLTGRSLWTVTTKAGLGRCHGLRHLSATKGLDLTGGNVRAVRQHTRHESVDIVLRYDDARSDQAGAVAKLIDAWLDVE
jgi:integrase/recombinase XerC